MMRTHRVFVDASIVKPTSCGYGTYAVSLVRALAARPGCELIVASSVPDAFAGMPDVLVVPLPERTRSFAQRTVWREAQLPALLRRHDADVLLAPVPELPLRRLSTATIAVIHDVSQIAAPELYGWAKWIRFSVGHRHILATADAVVCVSHATLMALRYSVSDSVEHVHVIGEAPQSLPALEEPGWRPRPYLLVVGRLVPHKNLPTLVDGFARSGLAGELDLVLSGPADERARASLERLSERHGVAHQVEQLGFLPPERLAVAYRHATALALPSVIEGFGLPVLEAMSVGTPVVASGLPALHEVAGDAALFVDRPLDPDAWAEALRRLARDGALRDRLSRAGLERAAMFSWERTAADFGRLIGELSNGHAPALDRDGWRDAAKLKPPRLVPSCARAALTRGRSISRARRARSAGPARALRILFYHRVTRERGLLSVTPAAFERQMDLLAREGYAVVDIATAWERLQHDGGGNGPVVALSFDDGYRDFAEHALPVLDRHRFTATVFVCPGLIDGSAPLSWCRRQPPLLSWDEIAALDGERARFEPHSLTHPNLTALDAAGAELEIRASSRLIEARLGRPTRVFCYPGGFAGSREQQLARQAGLELAVTCEPGVATPDSNPLALPRTAIQWHDSVRDFRAKLAGEHDEPLPGRALYQRLRYSRELSTT
jgi:glycosyltransferase involved in cell wall biosynthesis/peptidoglycan/xylan/chitin deacetylase (PgdA/CDA1 family)